MPSVERTITVAQPVEKVWTYLSDFTNTEEWDPPTVSTVRTSGDGGVGTTYTNVSKFLGHESEVKYEVVRFEPNSVFELTGSASGLDLRDTITFEERDGGTAVTYHSEFEPHGAAKLANPLLDGGLELLGNKVAKSIEEKLQTL
ncbi:SRPBCC family protein [Nocardioides panacisoli]|uniref:SRPBCC family protein n=1 Tax=Nocardioides panacisoli TaxID=627624 RepID=A0ABP7HWT0_9ACTN